MIKHTQPKFIQLKDLILNDIESLRTGDRLMPVRDMMVRFSTSQGTLEKALTSLEADGIIERRRGSGIYVSKSSISPKTNIIGVFVPDVTSTYANLLVEGIEKSLGAFRYRPLLCNGDKNFDDQTNPAESFRNQIDGAIVSSRTSNIFQPKFYNFFKRLNVSGDFPLVMIDIALPGIRGDFIGFEYYNAWHQMGYQLQKNNLTEKMLYITLEDSMISIEATHGFDAGLNEEGKIIPHWKIMRLNLGNVVEAVSEELEKNKYSIIVNTDPRFLRRLEALFLQKKLNIPEETIFVSAAEENYKESSVIPVIALKKPGVSLGSLAADTLKKKIDNKKTEAIQKLPLELEIPEILQAKFKM
ncbi:MAG: GntR family transcriptional regulator [Planctomycetota bacterium]|jgi:DNA-binding LacI/PurR family transcriptional regulator